MLSEERELQLIGGLLQLERNLQQIACSLLEEKHFFHSKSKTYFRTFKNLHDRSISKGSISLISFMAECERVSIEDVNKDLEALGYPQTPSTTKQLAETLIRDYEVREIELVASRMPKQGSEINDWRHYAESLINKIQEVESKSKLIDKTQNKTEAELFDELLESGGEEGYSTGISLLDNYINGLVVPRLTVLGALKKSGKSRFVIHLRTQLLKQGVPSLLISLEMPKKEIAILTMANRTRINDKAIVTKGVLNERLIRKLKEVNETAQSVAMECICESDVTVERIVEMIKEFSQRNPKGVVFIDYIQRIRHNHLNGAFELAEIANKIADASRKFGVHIVLLSQLTNLAEREEPNISHLKGSGGIAEAADSIIIMSNDGLSESEQSNIFTMRFDQRYGDKGKITIEGDLSTCCFADVGELEEAELIEMED